MASSSYDLEKEFSLSIGDTFESPDTCWKSLDETLRCRICFDYFSNCMMTRCSHNFCSVCIRRYMSYKAQCPLCFEDAFESELRNNRLVDEVLRIYLGMVKGDPRSFGAESLGPLESSSKILIKSERATQSSSHDHRDEKAPDEVACPVCYKMVNALRINAHLDSCLRDPDDRKRNLPKLVYHLLSDKEIKKKLKEHGLSVNGDRQTLIHRHKSYVILYNSNCDALCPKPVSDIVKEIEIQELEERLHSMPKLTQVNKKSNITAIEREHESYVKKHQSHFSALIQNIQERQCAQMGKQNRMAAEKTFKQEDTDDESSEDGAFSSCHKRSEPSPDKT